VMADLDRLLTPETSVVADASYATLWVTNYLTSRKAGMRFLTPRGLAGLGWGLPMALGAKAAKRDQPVICVAGDGGFAHCWAELETARRMRLNVTVVLLNNQVLGFQRDAELANFGAFTDACRFEPVDHAAIARACGCEGIRIEEAEAILPALKEAIAAERTTVLEVITDPEARPSLTVFEGRF
jgi:acetolactate synthase I/II/III large subunit